ncbi:MAG TPA: urease accessory protein UreD, partial [Terriglobales bacterium]|nr:urease accessory protein UreD [Terriglobales bacterium]
RFCGWEILGFGRPAFHEAFRSGQIDFRFELFREQKPLVLERLVSAAGRIAGLRDASACATFFATPANADVLARAREVLCNPGEALAAATLVEDVLIGRALAASCESLSTLFGRLWAAVRPLLFGRPACPPRIWRT